MAFLGKGDGLEFFAVKVKGHTVSVFVHDAAYKLYVIKVLETLLDCIQQCQNSGLFFCGQGIHGPNQKILAGSGQNHQIGAGQLGDDQIVAILDDGIGQCVVAGGYGVSLNRSSGNGYVHHSHDHAAS